MTEGSPQPGEASEPPEDAQRPEDPGDAHLDDEEQDAGTLSKLILTAAPFIFLVVVWLVLRAVSS